MSAGQANIELVLEVRNKIKGGLSSVRKIFAEAISGVRSKVKELQKDLREVFSSLNKAVEKFIDKSHDLRSGIKKLVGASKDQLKSLSSRAKDLGSDIKDVFKVSKKLANVEIKRGITEKVESPAKAAVRSNGGETEASSGALYNLGLDPSELKTQAIDKFKGALGQSIEMAAAWRDGMSKVNDTTKLSDEGLESLSKKVMDIAANNTQPLEDAPDSFNKLVKAGLSAQEALDAFDPALKAVKAGYSDMDTVVAATTATMQGTGIKDATEIMDTYFATVKNGNVEFNEVAKNLPGLIGPANQAGQSFKDMAGMFGFLTSQGLEADKATSLLQSTFQSIADPSIAKGFKDIGVGINDAEGKTRPMLDIIGELKNQFNGLTEEQKNTKLKAIGLDGDALSTVSSMISGYGELKGIIGETNNSQGSMNDAVDAAATPMDSWILLTNLFKQDMIDLGSIFLPLIDSFGSSMAPVAELIKDYSFWIQVLGGLILGAALAWGMYEIAVTAGTVVTEAFAAVNGALNAVMAANPIMLIVMGVAALIGGLIIAYKHSQAFRATLSGLLEVGKLLCDVFMGLGKILLGALAFNPKMFFEGSKQLTSSIKEIADGGISKRFNQGKLRLKNEEKAEALKQNKELAKGGNKPLAQSDFYKPGAAPVLGKPAASAKLAAPVKSSIGNTTGKAEQVKNLTINMDAMVKMGDFVSTNPEVSKMGKRELEQWFMELCARMIRNMEMSYS